MSSRMGVQCVFQEIRTDSIFAVLLYLVENGTLEHSGVANLLAIRLRLAYCFMVLY